MDLTEEERGMGTYPLGILASGPGCLPLSPCGAKAQTPSGASF